MAKLPVRVILSNISQVPHQGAHVPGDDASDQIVHTMTL
jgi:hypothetical protein